MFVLKRDGTRVPFDGQKIISAVKKAGLNESQALDLLDLVKSSMVENTDYHVEAVHGMVEQVLEKIDYISWANYRDYRKQRDEAREEVHVGRQALSEYILHSKYAHPGEEWDDVIDRVLQMHSRQLNPDNVWIKAAQDAMSAKMVLPSMRSLQFGGPAIEANHARLYNCSFSLCDRVKFFSETFFLLLSGCGVGYSVSRDHVSKLPPVDYSEASITTHRVTDTIEGWADAAFALINGAMSGQYVEFIYHDIRPKGSILQTTKGVAPGHIPLKRALENVRSVLESANGRTLTPFECHRIVCFLAEGVLSGGIRRSSCICLFDENDREMFDCKRGDWYEKYPELRLSNNSVIIRSGRDHSPDFWQGMVEAFMEFGEPGYFVTSEGYYGTNPCGEIGLNPVYFFADSDTGELRPATGFAFCNLTEVNVAACDNEDELFAACEIAAVLGTWQASYTDFHYLTEVTKEIARRDALLGVSMTGIQEAKFELTDEILRECAHQVRHTNRVIADEIDIRPAQRATCIKPSGTASLFLGTTPGIHPAHAKWMFRRVTANESEPVFQAFKEVNPHMCEKKPDGDWVITFPLWSDGTTRHDMSAKELMAEVCRFYELWVEGGNAHEYQPDLSHNVSCTVTVKNDERQDVVDFLQENHSRVQAMSFLADYGDVVYPFAPFEEVRTVADLARWIELARWYRKVDYSQVGVSDFGAACEGPKCEI